MMFDHHVRLKGFLGLAAMKFDEKPAMLQGPLVPSSGRRQKSEARPTLGPRAVAILVMGRYDDPLRRGPVWACGRAATGWRHLAPPTL